MAVKHTPGPWRIFDPYWSEIQTTDQETVASCWHEQADGKSITVRGVLLCSVEESAANARLIAAAPDLLDLLVRLVSENDSASSDPVASQWPNSPMRDEALILIAKATGEQP